MNFKKELICTLTEMLFAIFVVIFAINLEMKFDKSAYDTAKYYSNTKEVLVDIDDVPILLTNDESMVESNTLSLHNISGKDNLTTLMIKINKDNILFKNNTILKIDDKYYNLEELNYEEDDNYIYIILDTINFEGYETKELKVKLLTKDLVETNIIDYLNYEFVSQI